MLMQPGGEAPKTTSSAPGRGVKPKLFAPITSNKNGCESNNNLKTITCATSAQFPK